MRLRVGRFTIPHVCVSCGNDVGNTFRDGQFSGATGHAWLDCGRCGNTFKLVYEGHDQMEVTWTHAPKKRTTWDIARDARAMSSPGLYWVKAMYHDKTFTPWSLYERTTLGAYVLVWGQPIPESPADVRWRGPINPDDMSTEGAE